MHQGRRGEVTGHITFSQETEMNFPFYSAQDLCVWDGAAHSENRFLILIILI